MTDAARPNRLTADSRRGQNTVTEMEKSGVDKPYRYSTKEWDEKSGLYYFGFRYYYPEIGRWIQRDPAGSAGARGRRHLLI